MTISHSGLLILGHPVDWGDAKLILTTRRTPRV